ncbi:AfsR/SARP family transcriptional regulator [Kribbella ginsengisoli]|uniref:BTAD domain-containing putative transcriptional regulator n=1 Tax=Kribbella ginsengisoli TaxID=363865 RepID=A0ABP6YRU1_9ACTN
MDFRLLGAIEVAGQAAPLRRQERSLLAILLLRANEPVPPAELVDLLWPEDPPADARGSLQVYLSRLRKALPGVTITSSTAGYAVQVDPESIDVERFRRQLASARTESDPVLRADGLRRALDLWRGDPLADLMPQATRDRLSAGLVEEHAAAVEDRLDADLLAGRHEQVEGELADLVRAHPQRERLMAAWMTALYRSGRKAEALQAYKDLAERLAEEFGLDPAPALRRLHLAILRDDPGLRAAAAKRAEGTVPRELPVDISLLVGRDDLLADAVRVLTQVTPSHLTGAAGAADSAGAGGMGGAGDGRGRVAVYCLWGGAGVGKSAAGTRIGHLVAESFPDGQLFARLQDVRGEAVSAHALLGRMLRALGVQPGAVPASAADRAEMFRQRTESLAILLVLDDALDAGIVAQLLPTGPHCAVLVTSRKPLPELTEAVHRQVTPLDGPTSQALLTRLIGRTLRDLPTLDSVAEQCVGLPLALRIIGSRLALSGDDALQSIAQALVDDDQRLDSMVAGDLAVRTSLGRTLKLADPQARQLLERLSLVGITEFPSWVAAPLLDSDEVTGGNTFGRLVDLGLVELVNGQRYKMHDLVRAYAAEQLALAGDRDEPLGRYLQAVLRLAGLVDNRLPHGLTVAARLVVPDRPLLPAAESDAIAAPAAWMDDSWPLIRAAVFAGLQSGHPVEAAELALRLNGYCVIQALDDLRAEVLSAARAVVKESGPLELYVRLAFGLLPALPDLSPADRLAAGEELLDLSEQLGSVELQVRAMFHISIGANQSMDLDRAQEVMTKALELTEQPDGPDDLRVFVLQQLSIIAAERRDFEAGAGWARELHAMAPPGTISEGDGLLLLGENEIELRRYDDAMATLTRAADIYRAVGNDFTVARVQAMMALVASRTGDTTLARELLDQAIDWDRRHPGTNLMDLVELNEADLMMALGGVEESRRTRLRLAEKAGASGQLTLQHEIQRLVDTDPRDPANQG